MRRSVASRRCSSTHRGRCYRCPPTFGKPAATPGAADEHHRTGRPEDPQRRSRRLRRTVRRCGSSRAATTVRVVLDGRTIADSTAVKYLFERDHLPVYYFPLADVDQTLLQRSEKTTHCPRKGDATYWSVRVGDRSPQDAVWGYESPIEAAAELAGHVAFYWKQFDHWYEEDEEVFVHARDPYKRVDSLPSSRHVRIERDGVLLAETRRPVLLFETGIDDPLLPPSRGRLDGRPARVRHRQPVPVQGPRLLLLRPDRRRAGARHRLDIHVPGARGAAPGAADRVLRRARRHLGRRRAAPASSVRLVVVDLTVVGLAPPPRRGSGARPDARAPQRFRTPAARGWWHVNHHLSSTPPRRLPPAGIRGVPTAPRAASRASCAAPPARRPVAPSW